MISQIIPYIRQKYVPLKNALIIAFLILSTIASATDYYISSSGNDANNGLSSSTPWKTIAKVNSFFSALKPGDRILFNRGDTFSGTITITSSGSPGSPICICAYGTGDYPVISGFRALSGWMNKSGNIWQANVSTSKSNLNILTIDEKQYGMGRYPNSNYLSYESHVDNSSIVDNQLTGNPNWTGAEVVIRKERWMLDRNVITNHTASTLTYESGTSWTPTDTYGYFIQNDPKTLDVFGEWYFNSSDNTLRIYSSVNPSSYKIKASVIDVLIFIDHKDYVTFENLTLEGANQYAFLNVSGQHINILNCNINFSGIDGIYTSDNSIDAIMLLDGLSINHANASAIHLRNSTTYAWIKNNTIKNIGIIPGAGTNNDFSGDGIAFYGNNTLVEFNSIDSVGHSGIRFSNCDSVQIRNNFISNFCLVRYDGGGIYSWNNNSTTTHGQKIIDNIVLNGNAICSGIGSERSNLVRGIFLDENCVNIDITGNTTASCPTAGIYLLRSSDIKINNNTSYNNGSQIKFAFKFGSFRQIRNCYVFDNIFIAKEPNQLALSFESTANDIALFGTADNNFYARPIDDDNLFYTYEPFSGSKTLTLKGWQLLTNQDVNSHKSPIPINNTNEFRFEYNPSKKNKVINLDKPMLDIRGTKYQNSIALLPYTSVVLMVDPSPNVVANALYVSSAVANPTPSILEMTYNMTLANIVPAAASFSVLVNSIAITISSVAISGTKVLLTLASPIIYGNVVTVSYTKPSSNLLQTTSGGQAVTISAQPVVNNCINAANMPPVIIISNPQKGNKFENPATITIDAVASDPDGTISKVEFYSGAVKLVELTSVPYIYTWKDVKTGTYSITAIATDNLNATTTSLPIEFKVGANIKYDANSEIVNLYPNPNDGHFSIEFINPLQNEKSELVITDLAGKQVYNGPVLKEETIKQIDLPYVKSGIYILMIIYKGILVTKKIIIN